MIVHGISILHELFTVRALIIFGRAQMNVAHVSSSVVFPAKGGITNDASKSSILKMSTAPHQVIDS